MRLASAFLLLAVSSTSTMAQSFEGNWECLRGPDAAGILTIYGPSYGFASKSFEDPASGVGSVTGYADGVQFNDGNLRAQLAIEAGRLVEIEGETVLQLETATEILMICSGHRP